jgi:hypothetical protein
MRRWWHRPVPDAEAAAREQPGEALHQPLLQRRLTVVALAMTHVQYRFHQLVSLLFCRTCVWYPFSQ